MGKVGSTSLYESLKVHVSLFEIIHVHTLNKEYLKQREQFIKEKIYRDKQYPRHVYSHLLWKPMWVNQILKRVKKPLHLITVIREPISRNISLFFQWMELEETETSYFFKSRNEKYPFQLYTPKDDLTELYKIFIHMFTAQSHTDWLQEELRYVFQIDLLKLPFDKSKNYSIYEDSEQRVLVLKLEKISQTFDEAMEAFLHVKIPLLRANEASGKNIKGVYGSFKKELTLPKEYIASLYDSQYVKHFYTSDEIENFKSQWNTAR